MASNTPQLCRLCTETSDNLVNISETFNNSTIASILSQHFWFEVIVMRFAFIFIQKIFALTIAPFNSVGRSK